MLRVIVAVTLMVAQAGAAPSWVKAANKDICAGIEVPCTDLTSCTKVYAGPCSNTTVGPTTYIMSSFVGMAFTTTSDPMVYSTNNNKFKAVDPTTSLNINGYRDFSQSIPVPSGAGSGNYAYIMTGGYFGDTPASMGGYIGIATYLMLSGTISTTMNKIYYPAAPNDPFVLRNGNDRGASADSDLCIVPTSGGNCGTAPLTFNEGDFKFSIFGGSTGTNYDLNKVMSGITYLGVRMQYSLTTPASDATIKFNDQLVGTGVMGVTTISISSPTAGSITITLPTIYNVGTSGQTGGLITKTAKINALPVTGSTSQFYIDYLFESSDLNVTGKYFIYDPTLRAALASSQITSTAAVNSTSPASTGKKSNAASLSSDSAVFVVMLLIASVIHITH